TDGNFSYRPSELRALEPVTLHLEGVEVHQVLDLLADGRELQWGVQDDVIMLRGEIKPRTGIRVYDVRDLLLNVEDRTPTGTAILAEEGREDQDNRGQWGGEDGGDREFGRDNGDGDSRRGSQPLAGRAYDLGNLITSSVRPRSWDQPAVLMFGGQSNERD
ncbi:MAG: STN domain-containing protein, partial [Planctomycetota bacterium]